MPNPPGPPGPSPSPPAAPAPAWSWRLEDSAGTPMSVEGLEMPDFPSQSDAESWVGEVWREVPAAGGGAGTLLAGGRGGYGPMSLHAS